MNPIVNSIVVRSIREKENHRHLKWCVLLDIFLTEKNNIIQFDLKINLNLWHIYRLFSMTSTRIIIKWREKCLFFIPKNN